jgi:hypothetical protein
LIKKYLEDPESENTGYKGEYQGAIYHQHYFYSGELNQSEIRYYNATSEPNIWRQYSPQNWYEGTVGYSTLAGTGDSYIAYHNRRQYGHQIFFHPKPGEAKLSPLFEVTAFLQQLQKAELFGRYDQDSKRVVQI